MRASSALLVWVPGQPASLTHVGCVEIGGLGSIICPKWGHGHPRRMMAVEGVGLTATPTFGMAVPEAEQWPRLDYELGQIDPIPCAAAAA